MKGAGAKIHKYLYPLAAALAVTVLIGLGPFGRVDKWAQDYLFQKKRVPSPDIVIIGIDEEALDMLGPYNTWDRTVVAAALEKLSSDPDQKPAVTAVDILYAGTSSPEADRRLAGAAGTLGNVVTASMARFGESIVWENGRVLDLQTSAVLDYYEPFEDLKAVTGQGHINAMTDLDGVMRHALLYVDRGEGEKVLSMAAMTAKLYLEGKGETLVLPPTDRADHFYIPYSAGPGDFYDGVSIAMLLSGQVPPAYYAGKIVLIGPYAPGLQDAYFTSIDKGSQMYGVEIQANIIQSLLEKNFKRETGELLQLFFLFLAGAGAMLLFLRLRVSGGAGLLASLLAFSLVLTINFFKAGILTHPLYLPIALTALYVLSLAAHYVQAARARRALELERERIEAELSLATRIQLSALPKEDPPFPEREEFELYADMRPAREVGGDFYDFFLIDRDHLGLVIADVSGKGVPAALFMMVSMSMIRHAAMEAEGGADPAAVLRTVNRQICSRNPEEMFVTVWLGILEISTGKLTCSDAGHEYPLLYGKDGSLRIVKDAHGFVLGAMEMVRYRSYSLDLKAGDTLFVYTDGVTEAENEEKELFGMDRLTEALARAGSLAPADLVGQIQQEAAAFAGKAPQSDDMTMLCIRYLGRKTGLDHLQD